MDESKVNSFDDMMSVADAKLNAPIEPITRKVVPESRRSEPEREAPEDNPRDEERKEPGDGEPEAEPEFEVDEQRYTRAQIRELNAKAAKVAEADQIRRTAEYLLQHPEEYARVRREQGLEREPEAKPEPKVNRGPDPVDDVNGWKYARFNQYVDYLRQRNQTATADQITAQVEQDHTHARTERMHEILLEERAERKAQQQKTEKEQAQWRQDQEAVGIARVLTPLFNKYPEAATAQGQKMVEALIIRAVHLGEGVDYEGIVKDVQQQRRAILREYSQDKRAMANGTAPASGRGGTARGSRAKLADSLPADFSSLSKYAEMRERGEI